MALLLKELDTKMWANSKVKADGSDFLANKTVCLVLELYM